MRRLALSLVAVLAIAGCGESAAGIGETASRRLAPQVEQVRTAAMGGDRATAGLRLAELRASVADLRQGGELSDAGAAEILAAAAEVEAQLGTPSPTPVPTTVSAPAVTVRTVPPAAPGRGGGNDDDDKGNGKGNGRDD